MLTFVLQCSKSCGGGTRRRGAVCRKAAEAGGDESKCNQRDKLAVQPCNEFLCPQWKTGDWSEVSLTLLILSLLATCRFSFKRIGQMEEMTAYTVNTYIKAFLFQRV